MNKIKNVKIKKFWGDKDVILNLNSDVNFLIGVNGSGKTTIINLIAATLKADFKTLDRIQFDSIEILFFPTRRNSSKQQGSIKVEKKKNEITPFPKIVYHLKNFEGKTSRSFQLDEIEEDNYYRYRNELFFDDNRIKNLRTDLNSELKELVNVSWLTIHRFSNTLKREFNYESTIDLKIEELQGDLVRYFSQLDRKYRDETEHFQKFIFESLINTDQYGTSSLFLSKIDINAEKQSLKSIFTYFKLNEGNYENKLEKYFENYITARKKFDSRDDEEKITLTDFSYLLGASRIHSVVNEWQKIIEKQKSINKVKDTFIEVLNHMLIRKEVFINERNELKVRTQSGKIFGLTSLSSGEKQLVIIFGQSLLQEENTHIYIADEPELSLHIEWQEQLVKNLKSINQNSQIIFATHSPDIVSEFSDNIIEIEKSIS